MRERKWICRLFISPRRSRTSFCWRCWWQDFCSRAPLMECYSSFCPLGASSWTYRWELSFREQLWLTRACDSAETKISTHRSGVPQPAKCFSPSASPWAASLCTAATTISETTFTGTKFCTWHFFTQNCLSASNYKINELLSIKMDYEFFYEH